MIHFKTLSKNIITVNISQKRNVKNIDLKTLYHTILYKEIFITKIKVKILLIKSMSILISENNNSIDRILLNIYFMFNSKIKMKPDMKK